MTTKRTILIPYDFTPLSDHALHYGAKVAKIIDGETYLLHVMENISDENSIREKLISIAHSIEKQYGIKPLVIVRPGKVTRIIKAVAQEINSSLVIMKTSGPVGMQKFVGSRAIKVMHKSKIPFIVVQDKPAHEIITKVVFPIDFRKENKEKLSLIRFMAEYYPSKVHLFKPKTDDFNIRNNLNFAKKFLDGRNIEYEIHTAEKPGNLPEQTIEYANKIDADLIVIMLTRYITIGKVLLGLRDQKYITNKYKIPVVCLNPRPNAKLESFN